MSGLELPQASIDAAVRYGATTVRAELSEIITPAVAAELRRLADELSAIGYAHARVMRHARSRADELDGEAS